MKNAAGWETEESWFDCRQGKKRFFETRTSSQRLTQPSVQWVYWCLVTGVNKLGREVDRLVARLRQRGAVPTPATRCHVVRNDFTFSFYQQFSSVTGYWFSHAFRHICRFTASSGVTFLSFLTLSTSFFPTSF
jgi:hypothetical protein